MFLKKNLRMCQGVFCGLVGLTFLESFFDQCCDGLNVFDCFWGECIKWIMKEAVLQK